jgi:hypothetical protein
LPETASGATKRGSSPGERPRYGLNTDLDAFTNTTTNDHAGQDLTEKLFGTVWRRLSQRLVGGTGILNIGLTDQPKQLADATNRPHHARADVDELLLPIWRTLKGHLRRPAI